MPEFQKADRIFATFIVSEGVFPVGILGLLLGAVFSAAMSTLSSSLNSSATALLNDIWAPWRGGLDDRAKLRAVRSFTILFGLAQIAVGIGGKYVDESVVISVLGIADDEAESRFGWFMEALRYGTPPHAGFAVGIDRLVSILQGEANIREVIPFPKTQTGTDPLTESPTPVVDEQLGELGLELTPEVKAAMEADEEPSAD